MKKCPTCKSVYTDDTLAFCLADGTSLDRLSNSEETIQFASFPTEPMIHGATVAPRDEVITKEIDRPIKRTSGGSNVWIFSTVGLLSLIIGGTAVFLLVRNSNTGQQTDKAVASPEPARSVEPANLAPATNTRASQPAFSTPAGQRPATPSPQPANQQTPAAQPPSGGTYRVVRTAVNDVLFIRRAPGDLKSMVVGTIPANGHGIVVTGPGVPAGRSIWYPVTYNGMSGWVSGRFIAPE
jgi:hypothetical protein